MALEFWSHSAKKSQEIEHDEDCLRAKLNMKSIKYLLFGLFAALAVWAAFQIVFYTKPPVQPTRQGLTISQWLQKLRSNTNSTENPLKIAKITNKRDRDIVEFEVPLSYDLLAKYDFLEGNGRLHLLSGAHTLSTYCERATNGNCILGCDANAFTPGTNQIKVQFFILNPSNIDRSLYATGPVANFVSSNVCQVNEQITFDRSSGKIVLWADLSIPDAIYNIELLDTNGDHIKTISGVTTNGTINERWNLIGDSGKKYPFNAFNAVFHITRTNALVQTMDQTQNVQSP